MLCSTALPGFSGLLSGPRSTQAFPDVSSGNSIHSSVLKATYMLSLPSNRIGPLVLDFTPQHRAFCRCAHCFHYQKEHDALTIPPVRLRRTSKAPGRLCRASVTCQQPDPGLAALQLCFVLVLCCQFIDERVLYACEDA